MRTFSPAVPAALLLLLVGCSADRSTGPLGPKKAAHDEFCDNSNAFYNGCAGPVSEPMYVPTGYIDLDIDADLNELSPAPATYTAASGDPCALKPDPNFSDARTESRSAACPSGPCYALWQDKKAAFWSMMGNGVLQAGSYAAVYITPAGAAIRVVYTTYAMAVGGTIVGWSSAYSYNNARARLDQCVTNNASGFYHVIVIK